MTARSQNQQAQQAQAQPAKRAQPLAQDDTGKSVLSATQFGALLSRLILAVLLCLVVIVVTYLLMTTVLSGSPNGETTAISILFIFLLLAAIAGLAVALVFFVRYK